LCLQARGHERVVLRVAGQVSILNESVEESAGFPPTVGVWQ
jgi:hypothetical protein